VKSRNDSFFASRSRGLRPAAPAADVPPALQHIAEVTRRVRQVPRPGRAGDKPREKLEAEFPKHRTRSPPTTRVAQMIEYL